MHAGRIRRSSTVVAVVGLALGLLAACQPATSLPVTYNVAAATPYVLQPSKAPAGSNDWACKPSAAHPRPVILVNGTFATMGENWATLSPLLKNDGYCVFAFNYGATALTTLTNGNITSIGAVPASAAELSTFVNKVLAATGAAKVDLVGHSQGGMMPRYYLNFLGGAPKVNALVALAPSSHGTDLGGLVTYGNQLGTIWPGLMPFINTVLAAGAPALVDQQVGSDFMQKMATKPDTVAGVTYTVITSKYDQVVTPYQSQFLTGSNVTNILLQDRCSKDLSDHVAVAFSRISLQYVRNALDPAHAVTPPCTSILPGVVG